MKRIVIIVCLSTIILQSVLAIGAQTQSAGVRAFREAHEAEIIAEFVDLLSIPNVAADTPNIRRNAEKLLLMMRRRGIQSRLLEGNGPPAVFGELKAARATQTICLYAHYDGQPVDASKWASDPFKPTLRDKPLEQGGQV